MKILNNMIKVSVLLPVYNEEPNLVVLCERIHKSFKDAKISYEIIAVDDHSTDKSYQTLKNLSHKYPVSAFLKKGERGKAYSLLQASRHAKGDIFCMIDSDLQYPPEVIPQMVQMMETHGVVVGKRVKYDGSLLRRLGSKCVSFCFGRLMHGLTCDIQSGLKVFRKEILTHMPKDQVTAWAFDLPLLHTAKELGHSIGEVEIAFDKRVHGESKLSLLKPTLDIGIGSIKLKFQQTLPIIINPDSKNSMIGAGLIHKRQRFITHSTLTHRKTALHTISRGQKRALLALLLLVLMGIVLNAKETAIIVVAILSFVYFVDVIFNFFLILKSLHSPPELEFDPKTIDALRDENVPIYTILCPLYKEAHILPGFMEAMDKLDWPKDKLDIILLFEADDQETIDTVKNMAMPSHFRVVIVPDSQPKTKPKACNYGLNLARGEYVVIYDAEDIPEASQLKKAYLGFQTVGQNVKCLQAKLNYYNPHQNWLTRFFTAEYSLWFDVILTGLQSIQTNIPLGGTSNHFRTKDLIDLRGWDPFNVTEDCDLGIRLFKEGYKTAIINSTTLEEANSNAKNWLRQRSRWIKGYMQTYLIHMRHPLEFVRSQGWHALLFQLTIGGKLAFILINPILWVLTISYFALYTYVGPTIESLYPSLVFYMAVTSLIFGNFMFIYYYMIGCAKREHWTVIKWVYLIPIYWLMVSIAGAIALYQLIVKPHYWEKTVHGLHLKKKLQETTKAGTRELVAEAAVQAEKAPQTTFQTQVKYGPQWLAQIAALREKLQFMSLARVIRLLKKPTYQGGLLLITANMAGNALNMFTSFYLGQKLGLAEFGLVNTFTSLVFLSSIITSALSSTINYQTSYLMGKYKTQSLIHFWKYIRYRAWWTGLVITLGWLLVASWLPSFFNAPSIMPFILFSGIWLIEILAAVDKGYLHGKMSFGSAALINFADPLVKTLFAVVLSYLVPGAAYIAIGIGILAAYAIGYWKARQGTDTFDKTHEFHLPRGLFFASLISGLTSISFFSLDNILVAHYFNLTEAGQYGLLGLFGKMIFFVGSLTTAFLAPLVARNEGAKRNSKSVFRLTLLSVITMTGLAYLCFAIGTYFISPIYFGEKINAIRDYLPLYGMAITFYTISSVILSYHLVKKHYVFPIMSIIVAIAQVVGLSLFHQNLSQVVIVMFGISLLNFILFTILHTWYKQIAMPLQNWLDFTDLFKNLSPSFSQPDQNKALRILILNWRDTRHSWAGGAEVYIHEVAKGLVKAGHQVTVFCGNDGHSPRNEVIDGVQMVRRGGFYTVYFWACIYYVLKFRHFVDLVIDSENGIPFLTPCFVRKPVFLLIHHIHQDIFRRHLKFPFKEIALFIETFIMPTIYRSSSVITVSESSKKEILALGLGTPSSVTIINPGIHLADFKSSKKTTHPSLCYVGRLKPYKNVHTVIKALPDLVKEHPTLHFTVAGTGESLEELTTMAQSLGVEKNVTFLGSVTNQKKAEILAESWIAVQPSTIEGWGITVIEANASGTPVVASKVSGLKDSVQDQVTGMLVPPHSVSAWVKAIDTLITHPTALKKLATQAKIWSERFDWEYSLAILMNHMRMSHDEQKYKASQRMLSLSAETED